ncbi:MAG TPA: hypothetical protein VGK02_11070 [Candidatus Aquicultor sp.]
MDLKKILPIAIITIAVLAVVVYAAFRPATPQDQALTGQTGAVGQTQTQAPATQSQAPAAAPSVPADTKPVSSTAPATLVPAGMTLEQFCEKYYKAWMAKDWKTAYDLQPYSKRNAKATQADIDSFGQSREGYGLTGYQIGTPQVSGNVGTVDIQMNLGTNGTWQTIWTFVKNDKGQWTVQDSQVSMTGAAGGTGQ